MSEATTSHPSSPTGVTVLGLGSMGSALAAALLDAGHPVTAWNRTPGRAAALVDRGARDVASLADAIAAGPLVIACLLDHASVHETLDPVAEDLRGRTLVNVTTTTPEEARELAGWAAERGIDHLDGAIMATPPMIGTRAAQVFYSGSRTAYDAWRPLLDQWATCEFHGEDAGMASLLDLAMLSGMYQMIAGFLHGAAMVDSAGIGAGEFARRATPFLSAMTASFGHYAEVIDGGDYTVSGQQSLDFSDPGYIVRASEEQGVDPAPISAVRTLIRRQIDAGHGAEGLARVYEGLRSPGSEEVA